MKRKITLTVTCAYLIIALTTLLTGIPAYGQQVVTAPYFPLYPGSWWKYSKNGTETYVETVLTDPVVVNSVLTTVIARPEEMEYVTNDSFGIREHRIKENSFDYTVTFIPPVLLSPPLATLGQLTDSQGTARFDIPSTGTFDIAYRASTVPLTFESISVPYGTFESVKIKTTFRIFGTINGMTVDESSTAYTWLAKNIGSVKRIEYYDGKADEEVLIDTNLPMIKPILSPLHFLLLKRES